MEKNNSFITLPKWHRMILKSMAVGMIAFFIFAVLLYLLYDPGEEFNRTLYIKQFIVIPTVLQTIITAVYAFSVYCLEKHVSNMCMTVILSICITSYLGVMVAVHNSVPEMSILLIYPIFGATVYNSRTIMIMQSAVSMLAYILIKCIFIPNITVFTPVNTTMTYLIIFVGLNLGAVVISFFLRRMSTEIVNDSLKEKESLRLAAKTDQMTGLLNHSAFYKTLDKKISGAEPEKSFSLIVFDIDNFKKINDNFGHSSGDKIIMKAVNIIKSNIRSTDGAFRYGGEEFAVIIDSADEAYAAQIAERIGRSFLENENEPEFNGKRFSISSGVAEYIYGKYTSSEFFQAADNALYYAKNNGKNRCVRYSEIPSASPVKSA